MVYTMQGNPGAAFHCGSEGSRQSLSSGRWGTHPVVSAAHTAFGGDERKAAASARKEGSSPRHMWTCRHVALQSTTVSTWFQCNECSPMVTRLVPITCIVPRNSPCPQHPSTATVMYLLQGTAEPSKAQQAAHHSHQPALISSMERSGESNGPGALEIRRKSQDFWDKNWGS